MSNWVGFAVSVNCGEPLGCYQGTILQTDSNTITLTKAFRNGFPYPKSQVTLNASDIKDLKIIEAKPTSGVTEQSTVALNKTNKKPVRATVCENLQANNHPVNPQSSSSKSSRVSRSKPIDITPARNKQSTHAGSGGGGGSGGGSTPKSRGCGGSGGGGGGSTGGVGGGTAAARRRNEACFGSSASPAFEDFDFEGNLALFDKQATFNELRNKPDLLRQTEEKFRHDENVLAAGAAGAAEAAGAAGWSVPAELVAGTLRTDDGRAVPALPPAARARLHRALQAAPAAAAALPLLARAAADVALRLAGAPRRLQPANLHQAPVVAALVGGGWAGAAGVLAARLLASQGARAGVALLEPPRHVELQRELAAAAAAGLRTERRAAALPAPDVVLLALHEPAAPAPPAPAALAALRWARAARAQLLALEPCPAAWAGAGAARASLVALLPPALPPALGQLYLVDVAAPPALYAELGIARVPPFGPAALLQLHPDTDADADQR